jgi:hypothetical protein
MPSSTVFVDSLHRDDDRRRLLYQGQLFVYTARPAVGAFVRFASDFLCDAFGGRDPETAQHTMPVEEYAELLGRAKPRFIHDPESKRHVRAVLEELGCDPERTYFDVPRLRSSTSSGYLTTGIAYAWHPHRDTWYSAPACQINWWFPVFDLAPDNAMAFHPAYWGRPVRNDSGRYNYYEWNKAHRGADVARLIKEDPRPLPRATEPLDLTPQLRLLCPVGGLIVFSGASMHSSVPNTSGKTRFSVDFRTVHIDDARAGLGAPRTDEQCTGTTMRDYLRCTDHERLPEDVIAQYDDGTVGKGEAVYRPEVR